MLVSDTCVEVIPICIRDEIKTSDNLARMITSSVDLLDDDVLVLAQKIVSKQEGRIVNLSSVSPTPLARGIASQYKKDPRIVHLVLSESSRIVRMRDGIIIVETRSGIICANAGVDESNVRQGYATLLPEDPDASAQSLQSEVAQQSSRRVAVIISDTLGRPLRMGQVDCAIGVAGLAPILDYAGKVDSFGRQLRVTAIAIADEIAAAAELVMGKSRRCPAAIVRGCHVGDVTGTDASGGALHLLRPRNEDLFA